MGIIVKPAKRPLLLSTADLSSSLAERQIVMAAEPSVGRWEITCNVTEPASMSLSRSSLMFENLVATLGGKRMLPSKFPESQVRAASETKCSSRVMRGLVLAIVADCNGVFYTDFLPGCFL